MVVVLGGAAMQLAKWYVKTGDRIQGPFLESQIRAGLDHGKITTDMLLKRDDSSWIPAPVIAKKLQAFDRSQQELREQTPVTSNGAPVNGRPTPSKPQNANKLRQIANGKRRPTQRITTPIQNGQAPHGQTQPLNGHAQATPPVPTSPGLDRASPPRRRWTQKLAGVLSNLIPGRANRLALEEISFEVVARHNIGTIGEFTERVLAVCREHPDVARDLNEITGCEGELERNLLPKMDDFNMLAVVTILARNKLLDQVLL